MSQDFLVELGTEELPPKALKTLINAFEKGVVKGLNDADLSFTEVAPYAAPRRLALHIKDLAEQTPQKDVVLYGPPAHIAFADGKPTKAAEAFAKKNGIDVSELQTENDGKVEKLVHKAQSGGEATTTLLEGIIKTALEQLPIAKRMRWGASRTEFVRPVQWLVMLMGNDVVPATILGFESGRETRGHRFHCNQTLSLANASEYETTLHEQGYVVADYAKRQAMIVEQVNAAADNLGGIADVDSALLDEVTGLVELPVALAGRFEERFLDVPAEALVSSMKEHQKYFPVKTPDGKLLPHFITVANIQSNDPAQVIDGNERVIRPRLSDAAFFFETDKKTTLAAQRERLQSIVFQAKLGTIYDKTERVSRLAAVIAEQLNANVDNAQRAAQLCKSDLVSEMVSEFSDMQGIAGYYYAQNDGEADDVALAMNEQYMPRFAGDSLPTTTTGTIIALADRLDTLVGIFGIGQPPTGSKDPFALRRASLGVLRLLVEKELNLDLHQLLTQAQEQHKDLPEADGLADKVLAYMLERFRAWYEEDQIPAAVFQAVSAKQLSTPLDINKRVLAVYRFTQLPEAQALAAANKRVSNILSKQEGGISADVNSSLLKENAEKALASAVAEKAEEVAPLFADRQYTEVLESLASLQPTVDAFFDNVMVMADDDALKFNRLALLVQLRELFLQVADISLLVPAK